MTRSSKKAPSRFVVGIDLGGTNMQIGVVDHRNRIIGRDRRKTLGHEGFPRTVRRIAEGVQAACTEADVSIKQIDAVGIAAPGAIDIPRGIVLDAPNLRWKNAPLRTVLSRLLGRPVVVDNDVNGAVWGEFVLGAGRPIRSKAKKQPNSSVLGVWLGTGVGGGLVFDDRLYHGPLFTAGEVGQTVLFPEGRKGRRIVEDFCSRTGMSRTVGMGLKNHSKSMLRAAFEETGIVDSRTLAAAYRKRDNLAVQVIDEAADLLGISIANWVTVLSLDLVIVGGGVAEALGAPFLKRVRSSFEKDVFPARCRKARLVLTQLEDDAGLLGAALLARA